MVKKRKVDKKEFDKYLNELRLELEYNPLAWAKWYCKKHFRIPSPRFHQKIMDESLKHQFLAVAAPRESSKSTLLAFIRPANAIAYKKKRFILLVTNTYTKACSHLSTIKKEFKENYDLKQDFPIKIVKDSEGDTIFRHRDGFETRVLCKGAEQIGSVRGEKFGAYRPDFIIVDDLEDDELVRSRERRADLKDLFDDALIPAGEKGKVQVIVIGTILHDDSLMAKLVSKNYYPEYRKLFYRSLYEPKGREKLSLWKDKWSVEYLENMRKQKPSTFAKEMQNDPASIRDTKFNRDDFRYWKIENQMAILFGFEGEILSKYNLSDCKSAIACDLAWEEKRKSDYSVIMPAYLTPHSEILVENYVSKKGLRPHEIEEILFTMEDRLKAITGSSVYIGFEKAKLEKVIRFLLRQAMKTRNRYLNFKDLVWDADKNHRILTRLEPRYAQHSIFHKRGMGDLEHQLLRFPTGVHDDLIDGLQGLVQLLQYPKTVKKQSTGDNEFNWWRQQAIDARNPKKQRYIFGQKTTKFKIPATTSYR